jgi:hypothetical protein
MNLNAQETLKRGAYAGHRERAAAKEPNLAVCTGRRPPLTGRTAEDPRGAAVVAGTSTGFGLAAGSSTRSASISRLTTNALLVCRRQFTQ